MLTSSGRVTESRRELLQIFAKLPARTLHLQSAGPAALDDEPGTVETDRPVLDDETRERCREVIAVLMQLLGRLEADEQILVRGRFAEGHSVADIARALGVPQMPLYRRSEKLLASLRAWLEAAGVRKEDVADCIALDEP